MPRSAFGGDCSCVATQRSCREVNPFGALGRVTHAFALSFALAGVLLVMAASGCGSSPLRRANADAQIPDAGIDGVSVDAGLYPFQWTVHTDAGALLANSITQMGPAPKLDLVIVLDNSAAMSALQQALLDELASILNNFRRGVYFDHAWIGEKYDLRLALITSAIEASGGSCGDSIDGSLGRFRFANAATCGVTDGSQPWLFENRNVNPVQRNFTGELGTVFGCLAASVVAHGCAYSQPLRALESAFYDAPNRAVQRDQFLRADARLGIVIITNQDDCSDTSGAGIFTDVSGVQGESARLRCVTRSATCNGRSLSASPPGYPTAASFSAKLADCVTRTDFCGPGIDDSEPTECNPLQDYRLIAENTKRLKEEPYRVEVVGIFGWPPDETKMATAKLVIDKIPGPTVAGAAQSNIFDIWPVCYPPGYPPVDAANGFDPEAAARGATAGLRLAAFVDAFRDPRAKFSICLADLAPAFEWLAMMLYGSGGSRWPICVENRLVDIDPSQAELQASCRVWESVPAPGALQGPYTTTAPLPECDDVRATVPCWRLVGGPGPCENDQEIVVEHESDAFNEGTLVNVECLACPDLPSDGARPIAGCDYQP